MPIYSTIIQAIDPKDGTLKKWCGPNIEASNKREAREYCDENMLGYCKIGDEIVAYGSLYSDNYVDLQPNNPNLN